MKVSAPAIVLAAGLAAGLAALLAAGVARGEGDRALGEYLAAECAACHQISGRSVGAIPPIVGLPIDSFIALMNAYRAKERDNAAMRTIAAKLSDEEIAALAAYFGSIKPRP